MRVHHVEPTVPLLAVSFFAADVQAGVGPFLGIDLQAHCWTPDRIVTVLTIGGIVGMLVTTPAGALVDATAAYVAPAWSMVPLQVFDGVGAGLQSVAVPALVVHLLHGSGRVNLGQGAVQGVEAAGACFSPMLGGWLAQRHGYPVAFLALGSPSIVSHVIWIGYGRCAAGAMRGAKNSSSSPIWIHRRSCLDDA